MVRRFDHAVIDRNGAVAPGRQATEIDAYVEINNRGTIGTCLFGGFGAKADDPFEKSIAAEQAALFARLIAEITGRIGVRSDPGHNDYAAKSCPGFRVIALLG